MARMGLKRHRIEIWKSEKIKDSLGSYTDSKIKLKTKRASYKAIRNGINSDDYRETDQTTIEFTIWYDRSMETPNR